MIRTFIAVEITDEIRERLRDAQAEMAHAGAAVRWTAPENVHLTLRFLGDIDQAQVTEIAAVMNEAAGEVSPFTLPVRGVGAFPDLRRPHVLWVGITASEPLATLYEGLDAGLADFDVKQEMRGFTPHLTLGRVRGPSGIERLGEKLAALADEEFGEMTVDEIMLMMSDLTPAGAVYTPLARAALR